MRRRAVSFSAVYIYGISVLIDEGFGKQGKIYAL